MWHVSVAPKVGMLMGKNFARVIGLNVLKGVGDEEAGQWEEVGKRAYHIRRRLSAEEAEPIGPARDLRGTKEGEIRLMAIAKICPHIPRQIFQQELSGK